MKASTPKLNTATKTAIKNAYDSLANVKPGHRRDAAIQSCYRAAGCVVGNREIHSVDCVIAGGVRLGDVLVAAGL